jgi:hypothetical protein
MPKITHFSLASGMHREYLWFMLTHSFVIHMYVLILDCFPNLLAKKKNLPCIFRPDDDIRHWSKFPSFTPFVVINCQCWCC